MGLPAEFPEPTAGAYHVQPRAADAAHERLDLLPQRLQLRRILFGGFLCTDVLNALDLAQSKEDVLDVYGRTAERLGLMTSKVKGGTDG